MCTETFGLGIEKELLSTNELINATQIFTFYLYTKQTFDKQNTTKGTRKIEVLYNFARESRQVVDFQKGVTTLVFYRVDRTGRDPVCYTTEVTRSTTTRITKTW